jgi:hypothetical protein
LEGWRLEEGTLIVMMGYDGLKELKRLKELKVGRLEQGTLI